LVLSSVPEVQKQVANHAEQNCSVYFGRGAAHPYWPGRAGHGWDGIIPGEGYTQLKLNHVFKIFHNKAPQYLKLHFTRVSSVHNYSTRGSPFNFVVPKSKGQARFTFYNTAIHHWNALPNSIKNTEDLNTFKKMVKQYLASDTV
jgi:hypothetical protein